MLASVSWTTMQIRLRPRGSALLSLMSERERRRPQDQAAVLVERALQVWWDEQGPETPEAEVVEVSDP